LRVDERGDLILGPEVIAFFDYFFSASGEEPDEAIRARILAAIRERLDGPAGLQAAALLDQYIGFREAARALRVDLGFGAEGEADPAARLEVIRRLRREHFGEEAAEQLFGDEEQEAAVAAAQREVMRDPSLSPEEREAKIAALEADLPEAAQEARAEARRPLAQQAEEEALRAAGATPEELRRHRVATVGQEAADRLADLDRRREAWSQRVEEFRKERARIAAAMQDKRARGAAEQALLERSFTPQEQLRVRAILKAKGEPLGQ
jgi:lipase chaperone LimK